MVLPSGETSSETHVPSSVVNSIVRFDFSGSGAVFLLRLVFLVLVLSALVFLSPCSLSLSLGCPACAMAVGSAPRTRTASPP